MVGPAASLLGMRHQERADRVSAGGRKLLVWWWDVGILRARAVGVGRAQIAGFWLWRRGSWGVTGFVDRK